MQNTLLIVIACLLFAACRKLKAPEFKAISNVQVNKISLGKSTMRFDMTYYNPNNTGATLRKADGEAWMDSTYLGPFRVDSVVNIPALAEFIVPVNLEIEMKQLLKHSLSAFLNEEPLFTIKGTAIVSKGGFSKKIPLRYEGRQNLQALFK
ncbi:MAG: hypothetical protein H7Y42_16350 [Chitinophagaceae bacterium]|nr:hypothetical protein [Chitinophagaceae bacterium]